MLKKLIPTIHVKTIYDIDYLKLKEANIKLIMLDLDNTLITYRDSSPNEKLFKWKEELENLGFKLIIVSNSRKNRVEGFAEEFNIPCIKFSKKPSKSGFKKALEYFNNQYQTNEVLHIGDQLMTDVLGGNRMKFNTALVDAIERKSEKLPTRINRFYEAIFKFLLLIFRRKDYKNKIVGYGDDYAR